MIVDEHEPEGVGFGFFRCQAGFGQRGKTEPGTSMTGPPERRSVLSPGEMPASTEGSRPVEA